MQAELSAPDLRGDFPMSGESLRMYEEWPDGGRRPSVRTLELLAQTYETDLHNLLDRGEYELLTPSGLHMLNAKAPAEDKPKSSIADSIVGQAAAAVGIIAAVVYAAGGLTLGLKLWFFRLSWTPVLGQLPRNALLITAAGQVILPCVIAGAAIGTGIHWKGADIARVRRVRYLVVSVVIAALAGAIFGWAPLATLFFTSQAATRAEQVPAGLLQSGGRIWLFCGIFSGVTVLAALWLIRAFHKPGRIPHALQLTLTVAAVSFALIPCAASISSAYLLPPSCSARPHSCTL
jgi:hypothetical protein